MNDDQAVSQTTMPIPSSATLVRNPVEARSGGSSAAHDQDGASLGELAQLFANSGFQSDVETGRYDGAFHDQLPTTPNWLNSNAFPAEYREPEVSSNSTANLAEQMRMLGDTPQEGGAQAGFFDHPALPVRNIDGAQPLDLSRGSGNLFDARERNHDKKLSDARQAIQDMTPQREGATLTPPAEITPTDASRLQELRQELLRATEENKALHHKLKHRGSTPLQQRARAEVNNPQTRFGALLESLGILQRSNKDARQQVRGKQAFALAQQRAQQKAAAQKSLFGEAKMNKEQLRSLELGMMSNEPAGGDQD